MNVITVLLWSSKHKSSFQVASPRGHILGYLFSAFPKMEPSHVLLNLLAQGHSIFLNEVAISEGSTFEAWVCVFYAPPYSFAQLSTVSELLGPSLFISIATTISLI